MMPSDISIVLINRCLSQKRQPGVGPDQEIRPEEDHNASNKVFRGKRSRLVEIG
jgi:hypothetical protein